MRGLLAALALGALMAGCGGMLPAEGGETTLAVGGSIALSRVGSATQLTLVRVNDDSRCGIRELCIQPGWVDISLTLSGGGAADQAVTVRQGSAQDIPALGGRPGYRVAITAVRPDKDSAGETIPQSRYRIGLKIERLP